MKLLPVFLVLLVFAPLLAVGGESYFFNRKAGPKFDEKLVEDGHLFIVIPIKRLETPKAKAIHASQADLGEGRKYQIQIDLAGDPPEAWGNEGLLIKLGEDVIDRGISFGGGEKPMMHVEADDPEKIRKWCKLLGELLKIPEDKIGIDLTPPKKEAEEEEAEDVPAR